MDPRYQLPSTNPLDSEEEQQQQPPVYTEQSEVDPNQPNETGAVGGGRRKSSRKSASAKPKGPQPSAERVVVKGQKRIVYVGPKGGKYIKSKGEFVRI